MSKFVENSETAISVPHKSRQFRTILNLSYYLQMADEPMLSVNETTIPNSPEMALHHMGMVLPRLINAIATAESNAPFYFSKLDIKDGFWRVFTTEDS